MPGAGLELGLGAGGSGLAGLRARAARAIACRAQPASRAPSPQPPACYTRGSACRRDRRRTPRRHIRHRTPSSGSEAGCSSSAAGCPCRSRSSCCSPRPRPHSPLLAALGVAPRRRRRIAALVGGPPHRHDLPNEKPADRSPDCDRAVWSRQKSALPRQHRALARLRAERPAPVGRSSRAAPARRRISRHRQMGGRPSRPSAWATPTAPTSRRCPAGSRRSGPPRRRVLRCRARYSWRETLFSERGTLIAIAVGYLLLGAKRRCWGLGARGWGLEARELGLRGWGLGLGQQSEPRAPSPQSRSIRPP